ncbi:hypothetical protein ABH922_002814 [Rhodococcus sp. 27YEA15]|uniref:hypothetical protein n=1 Tax=Rhodococcus sp. 27YEA15 TaxID=3156259 RepID=UPI003C7A561B
MTQSKIIPIACWALLGVSALGLLGCMISTLWLGALVWVVVGAGAGYGLAAHRRNVRRAAERVIATRADLQDRDYLAGKPTGVFGDYQPPALP